MKKSLFLIILLLIFPVVVNAESKYLYDVLKDAAEEGTYAREYTGEHHDSFTEEPTKKIYYWYAPTGTTSPTISEGIKSKWNVVFANHCWRMIRTTDTGGVKLLYYGEVENGKCLYNRNNHVGYTAYMTQVLSNTYYYGTSFTYDKTTNLFRLDGIVSNGEIKTKMYTCKSSDLNGTCTTLYLVDTLSNESTYNVFRLEGNTNYAGYGHVYYNSLGSSLADVGYMSNKRYPTKTKNLTKKETLLSSSLLSTSTWFADSVTWNSSTNKYELVNPYQITSANDYPSLVGKYTFGSSSQVASYTSVNYITNTDNSTYYYIALNNGNNIDYYNDSYTIGDDITENDNGTFTIINPITIHRTDYYTNRNYFSRKYICKNATNNICSEIWFSSDISLKYFNYYTDDNLIKYAQGYTYNSTTGKYTLNNDSITTWILRGNEENLNSRHYTCFNENGECSTLIYIYYLNTDKTAFNYVELNDGKTLEDIINDMLYEEEVNKNDSTIKTAVDAWYRKYMSSYSDYLEDTIYCNDRSIEYLGSWNPTGKLNNNLIRFNYDDIYDLSCKRNTDMFSVSNTQAKLTFPVGLMTYSEMEMLGKHSLQYKSQTYWLMTPYSLGECYHISQEDDTYQYYVAASHGLSPAISLKPKSRYSSGDGSIDNPYIFDESSNYSIDVEINNETEDLTVEIDDLSQVPEGEIVNFKVTPIKGRKLTNLRIVDEENNEIEYTTTDNKNYTFTMPATDVTIIPTYERVKNAVNVEDNKNTKEFVIEVNDSRAVVYEDTVRFKIEPEDGYEVEKIEITDEGNNKISYKKTSNKNEYEFTMPDTDVLIKPKYRLIPTNNTLVNPNTKRQILLIVISVIILSIMTFIYIKKKKRLA